MLKVKVEDIKSNNYVLFFFIISLSIITYGFALTNYSLTIDNETPIYSDFGLIFGRWGQNLIRYHLFNGHYKYYSLLFSLLIYSFAALRLSNLLKFTGFSSYFFCGLFVSFPQLSYQLVFGMMADISALGFLLSIVAVELFIIFYNNKNVFIKYLFYLVLCCLMTFIISLYQAFIIVPATILVLYSFKKSFGDDFKIKNEIIQYFIFGIIMFISLLLYYFTTKIFCPPIQNSEYLSSFTNGGTSNMFSSFFELLKKHLQGNCYYGEKLFLFSSISALILLIKIFINKKAILFKSLLLLFLIAASFIIAFFITNGYYPPRIYLTSNLIFAFLIVFLINQFNFEKTILTHYFVGIMILINIYYITNLFISCNKIYNVDKRMAEKIDNVIQEKYPAFYSTNRNIYFYGYLPFEFHQKYRLPDSEIFGGSIYNWDNGNNYRITNFFREANVADYNMLDSKEMLDKVKDSIPKMPIWPNNESVKMIDNIIVVKLGNEKGGNLYFE